MPPVVGASVAKAVANVFPVLLSAPALYSTFKIPTVRKRQEGKVSPLQRVLIRFP